MCLHPAKFGGHMHCVSGGMMFLLFLLEEQESIFLHISAIIIFLKHMAFLALTHELLGQLNTFHPKLFQ